MLALSARGMLKPVLGLSDTYPPTLSLPRLPAQHFSYTTETPLQRPSNHSTHSPNSSTTLSSHTLTSLRQPQHFNAPFVVCSSLPSLLCFALFLPEIHLTIIFLADGQYFVLQRTYALRWRNGLRHALYLFIVYLHYLHLSSSHTNTKPEPFSFYSKLLFLMRLARCQYSALPPYISLCLSARENPDYRE